MDELPKESRVTLALIALRGVATLSIRHVAKVYNVSPTTIRRRLKCLKARAEIRPNSMNLTDSEERAIIQYIIDLSSRSFPPRLTGVEDIANQLGRKEQRGIAGRPRRYMIAPQLVRHIRVGCQNLAVEASWGTRSITCLAQSL